MDIGMIVLRPSWWLLYIGRGVQVGTFIGPWVWGIAGYSLAFPIIVHCLYLTFIHLCVWLW